MLTPTAPERETDVLRRGISLLTSRLPASWRANIAEEVHVGSGSRHADAIVDLTAPDGSTAALVFEAKRSIVVRDLPAVLNQLQAVISQLDQVRDLNILGGGACVLLAHPRRRLSCTNTRIGERACLPSRGFTPRGVRVVPSSGTKE